MTDSPVDRSVPPPSPRPTALTAPPPLLPELPEGVKAGEQRPRWKPWFAFAALVAGFLAATMGFFVVGAIATVFGASFADPPPAVTIIATIVQGVCLVAAAVFFAAKSGRPAPWQFGLRRAPLWPAVGWTVVAFVVFAALSAGWVELMGLHDEKDTLPDELGVDGSVAALLAVAFLVTVVAPIGEELFFRGFFFRALVNWKGIWPAALITGLTFGAIHAGGSPVGFLVPLGIFGFVLCMLYVRTQSIYPSIALHAINNSVAFGASQDWDWQVAVLMASSLSIIALAAYLVRRQFGVAPLRPSPI